VTTTYQHRFGVRAAVAEGTGGAWAAEVRDAVVKAGAPVRVRFGLNMEKSLMVTPREEMWIAGFSTAGETSGESLFTNNTKGAKTLTLSLAVAGGASGEGVAEVGICALSRKGESGPVTITARFSGQWVGPPHACAARGRGSGQHLLRVSRPRGRAHRGAGRSMARSSAATTHFSMTSVYHDDDSRRSGATEDGAENIRPG